MRQAQKSKLAGRLDRLGLCAFVFLCATGFFFFVFAPALPAVLAGAALSALLLPPLLARLRAREQKRGDAHMRALRAEEKLTALSLRSASEADRQAAALLAARCGLLRVRRENGVWLGEKDGRRIAVFYLRLHPSQQADAGALLAPLRRAKLARADRCAVCAPCPFTDEARLAAGSAQPEIVLFDGEAMRALLPENMPEEPPVFAPRSAQTKRRLAALCRRSLRKSACPRFLLLFVFSVLSLFAGGSPVFLFSAAAGAALFLFSMKKPGQSDLPGL